MNRLAFMLVALTTVSSAAGCFTTTVHSGRPVEPSPAVVLDGVEAAEFDDRWHHGFVNGVAEVNGNYNLRHICPDGWAEVKTEESFLTGLVTLATGFVYSPQTVSIRCAASGHSPVAAGPAVERH